MEFVVDFYFLICLFINVGLVFVLICCYYIYFCYWENVVLFILFGLGVFLVMLLLYFVMVIMGFVFGLFVVFFMFCYWIEVFGIKEMIYLFLVIVMVLFVVVGIM